MFFSWIELFHSAVPFNNSQYSSIANHYINDQRINGEQFSLLNALGQYDSQWYLKIADKGYPDHPPTLNKKSGETMDTLLYNFFPLFPMTIGFANIFFHNVQLSAFILNNLILLAIVYSLYFIVAKWFSRSIAVKTIFLIMLFPFSVFLRGYYSEGLRLLLFIWFCYGLTEKRYLLSAISVGLLCITNGISLLLVPYYYGFLILNRRRISFFKILLYFFIAVAPFLLWMIFCFIHTGNPFIFVATRAAWIRPSIFPFFYNIKLMLNFQRLPLLGVYNSQLDVLFIFLALCLTYLSENFLPKIVWYATIILVVSPLFVQDSISYARFSVVLFPFFVYLAAALKNKYYIILVCIFFVGLLISSLYFINWYWIE